MKKLIIVLLALLGVNAQAQTFPVNNLLVTGSFTAVGLVKPTDLASQAANTVLANSAATSASPTAFLMPSCSSPGVALNWAAGIGFTCNNISVNGIITQAATGKFYANTGARINRMNDRTLLGTATQYDGNQSPVTGDWSNTMFPVFGGSQGAYAYLVSNATEAVGAPFGELGITGYGRTSDGGGSGTQATIGVSAFVVNDNNIGAGAGSWAFYGTTVRTAAATGVNTNGMEMDVANLGSTVHLFPAAMFTTGQTGGLCLCAGGELQNTAGVTMGTNSVALAIVQNDINQHANWDKGIIFQNHSIAGADGNTGVGTAIAMAPGHQINYFNNSNQLTSGFFSTATTVGSVTANQQFVHISNFGTLFDDGAGNTQFQVNNTVANAVDHIVITGAATGGTPIIAAAGTDTNVSMTLQTKGSGVIFLQAVAILGHFTVGTLPACNGGIQGALAFVSDANAPTYNGTLSGGGTVSVPAFCNGGTWTAH